MLHTARFLAALLLAAPAARAQDPLDPQDAADEAPVETRSFSIPNTRLVKALYDSAEDHIAARRWSEAVDALQRILEDHPDDLLPDARPRNALGHVSDQPVHPGAAHRARARLFELPGEARELYVQRHGREAQAALEAARVRGDPRELVRLAQRWPLVPAATAAWWALGDLEYEAGRPRAAGFAWSRALAYALGDPAAAPRDAEAWARARERLAARGALPPGIAARIELAADLVRAGGGEAADPAAGLRLAGGGEACGPPPGPESDAWPEPYRLPDHPLRANPRGDGLFLTRSGDRLFVNTGLRCLALSAFGGELLWDSGEPPGWSGLTGQDRDDRFLGVNEKSVLLAAAVGGNVVVAPLQIPYVRVRVEDFQRIRITTPIPERRLFAFDARSGAPLWDHAPPILWDGESGDLARRMSCAGPPIVVGSRVLVPLVRMQGRIDMHVGCFDLATGALLWATPLISGQRELNMFGRAEKEFCAPPVRVEGDRVVVLTQLGAVACLDLFSGGILWEALYEQIPMPQNRNYGAQYRRTLWRNSPPVVCDGAVIVTPEDSGNLTVLELETGALLWEQRATTIQDMAGRGASVDLLLGAAGRTVYLGGDHVVALEAPSGLASRERLRARWTWPNDDELRYRVGRPLLCGDRVLVPFDSERYELALEDGRTLARLPWPGADGGGNLLVASGELYTCSTGYVRGVFEWNALIERARERLAAAPRDPRRVLELARLLSGRAGADWARGQGDRARERWHEARTALERALADAPAEARAALSAELALALRGEARVRAQLADADGALELLKRARDLAPSRADLRDTLLEEVAVRRARGVAERAAVLAVLDELARTCAGETLLVTTSEVRESADRGLRAAFEPLPRDAQDPGGATAIPVELWVLLERAAAHAALADTPAEYEDLHAVLARHADVDLPAGKAGDLATERILALLAAGRRDGYAPFEAQARAALEKARAAQDAEALTRVARAFPGSTAAREANDALLGLALQRADLPGIARIADGELAPEAGVGTADARGVRLLLHVAVAAQASGNGELAAELLRALAAAHPDLVPDVPGLDRARLLDLAERAARFERSPGTTEVGRFGPDFPELEVWPGDFDVLGIVPHDAALGATAADVPREMLLLETLRDGGPRAAFDSGPRGALLRLLPSDDPTTPRWLVELPASSLPQRGGSAPWNRRVAFAPGRALLALRDQVLALDAKDGEVAWRWTPGFDVETLTVATASGVAVVAAWPRGGERPVVAGLDARGGALLWRDTLLERGLSRNPLVGPRQVAHLPAPGQRRGLARDLFTGRVTARFELPTTAVGAVDVEAWCEGELLIVPWFDEMRLPERNHVVALDLARGELRWRLPFDSAAQHRMLTGVVQQGERTWLRIGGVPRDEDPLPAPVLAELSPSIGAASPLDAVRLAAEDVILGLPRDTRVRLPEGPLLVVSPPNGRDARRREARLRAIDPVRGELWAQELGPAFDDVRIGGLVQAAWSDRAVFVAVPRYDGKQPPPKLSTELFAYDRATGVPRGTRTIGREDKSDLAELFAFGETLLVRRNHQLEILR